MYLLKPLMAWFIAQVLKIIIEAFKNKKINFKRITGAGGMPSSHAALTVALTTALWKDFGISNPLVAVAIVFTLVVLYDATGVRRASGKQAAVLNLIIDELMQHKSLTDKRLKELLGHTPLQVLAGILLGFLVGFYF
ncbi:MAG: divergent PAP2 family protein [Desulfobacteraceae bacterium]|jgi:acid phosphatase family membrane protein YuiD|nr:MAG: divergent PAP2 family protein [Desulfobacteraceae bacterium]